MTKISELCKKCLLRQTTCERYYREEISECSDFQEGFDLDNPLNSTEVGEIGASAYFGGIVTGNPLGINEEVKEVNPTENHDDCVILPPPMEEEPLPPVSPNDGTFVTILWVYLIMAIFTFVADLIDTRDFVKMYDSGMFLWITLGVYAIGSFYGIYLLKSYHPSALIINMGLQIAGAVIGAFVGSIFYNYFGATLLFPYALLIEGFFMILFFLILHQFKVLFPKKVKEVGTFEIVYLAVFIIILFVPYVFVASSL